jgi:hypothetical protein
MAQGTLTLFEEFSLEIGDGTHDLDTDAFKIALLQDAVIPTAADLTPAFGDYTEVTGAGYTAGGAALTTTWTEAGGVATFDATGAPAASWTQNGSGPTDIEYGLIYNNTDVGKAAVGFVDMTTDAGVTPISLQAGDITWTPHASGIFTLS